MNEELNNLLIKINDNLENLVIDNKEIKESLSTIITALFQMDFDPNITIDNNQSTRDIQQIKAMVKEIKEQIVKQNG